MVPMFCPPFEFSGRRFAEIKSKFNKIVGFFSRSTNGKEALEKIQLKDNPDEQPLELI